MIFKRQWGIGVLLLSLVSVLVANAQPNPNTPPPLLWENAPLTPLLRHAGDVQVRLGWETREKALGPFTQLPFEVGDMTTFNITSPDDVRIFELYYRSENAYFWFIPGSEIDMEALEAAANRFDNEIWVTNRTLFGENATPGIDGDRRIHLVHLQSLFPGLAGFFNPDDQCARTICPRSNERDVLYLMLDYGPLNSDMYLATIAHEFQHMIQFTTDGNEYRWLDEGMSQLAEYVQGFNSDPINQTNLTVYLDSPNHRLNGWSPAYEEQSAYYGAGYLLAVYLYERFGSEFIEALARNPYDGLAGIHNTLVQGGYAAHVDEVIRDWWVANLINDASLDDGRYGYTQFELPATVATQNFPPIEDSARVSGQNQQYGATYFHVDEPGLYTLDFQGDIWTPVVPMGMPHSGDAVWWSYNASFSATTLTRIIDLTSVDAATLKFWVMGQTGNFAGHLHVLVSTNGREWRVMQGLNSELFNRYSNAPGPHYTNTDGEWMADFVDLSEYGGQMIQLRFEYVTNNSSTGPGFIIDDVGIPEIGWSDDFETIDEAWVADGFVRTTGIVPQRWSISLVSENNGISTVEHFPLIQGAGQLPIMVPDGGATIILGAMAPVSEVPSSYILQLTEVD